MKANPYYNPTLLEPYLKAKYDNQMKFSNQELYLLCNCQNDDQKGSVRALKSKYIKKWKSETKSETHPETTETSFEKKSNDYTSTSPEVPFHEESPNTHILGLIKKYPELPLFIYSKIFERVRPEHDKNNKEERAEYEKNKKVIKKYHLHFSFYELYMEIFNAINEGKLDQELKEYMKDVIQSFGNTHTYELEGREFKLSESEEDDYQCIEDYNWSLKWVLDIISETIDYFSEQLRVDELRVLILRYLFIKSTGVDNSFVSIIIDSMCKERIKLDIMRLYALGRKVYPNMESIEELYDEFDLRYQDKLDLKQRGINYKGQYDDDFYTDKKGKLRYKSTLEEALIWEREGIEGLGERGILNLEHLTEESTDFHNRYYKETLENRPDNYSILEKEYDPPIPELEGELNRLKGVDREI